MDFLNMTVPEFFNYAFYLVASGFFLYVSVRIKNTAKIDDMEELTKKVEEVKSDFNKEFAEFNQGLTKEITNINHQLSKEANIHKSLSQLEIEACVNWYKDWYVVYEYSCFIHSRAHERTYAAIKDDYDGLRNRFQTLIRQERISNGMLSIFINSKTELFNAIGELRISYYKTQEKLFTDSLGVLEKIDLTYLYGDYDSIRVSQHGREIENKIGDFAVETRKNVSDLSVLRIDVENKIRANLGDLAVDLSPNQIRVH